MHGQRIAITGATGNIGAKLRAHLGAAGADLVLLDRDAGGDPAIAQADLSHYQPAWVAALAGVDALVHLAADSRLDADWTRLERDNIDATLNVLHAAMAQGLRRVIFASSVQAMIGRVSREPLIDTAGPGAPVNLYGASKCVGERLGAHYARHFRLSVIVLRLGWVQPGDNLPGPHLGPLEHQQLWLSNRDLCRGIAAAIRVPGIAFGVFNLVSENQGMPWDLTKTTRVLGWIPMDRYAPQVPAAPQATRRGLVGLKRKLSEIFCR